MPISSMREKANNTDYPIQEQPIHEAFFRIASENPEYIAVVQRDGDNGLCSTSYGEVAAKAYRYSGYLQNCGMKNGEIVAVALDKGEEYISAVMGVLAAGGAFLPMSASVPPFRRSYICEKADVRYVIAAEQDKAFFEANGIHVILPEAIQNAVSAKACVPVAVDSDAYIIFTSGTTGEPKGVEIQHNAAYNTIVDINERFHVTEQDSIFAVSEIDFDLSVYDIFGMLSVGGRIIISDRGMKKEASSWKKLMRAANVTIWNSVPRLLEMLLTADADNEVIKDLRVILVSGDWVYPELVNRIREKNQAVRLIALGGATEASIWSNYYEVAGEADRTWRSVPYGVPLHNQKFRIVKENGRICEDYEEGEIQIGGKGLARGYINMPELTAKRFITDNGERWYRTGDKGKYWSDGNIEFLGRLDNQVKFGGFRVELDEITRILSKHPQISNAFTVMIQQAGKQYLASVAVPEISEEKCVPIRIGSTDDSKDNILSAQIAVTNFVIIKILELEHRLGDGIAEEALLKELAFTESCRPIYRYWLKKLTERECISIVDGQIYKGTQFETALYPQPSAFLDTFTEKLELLRTILQGKTEPAAILADEFLSPEIMSQHESGLDQGIEKIAVQLHEQYQRSGKPICLGIFGARTGVTAEKLLAKLKDIEVNVTLIDVSEYFLSQAKERLAEYHCSYAVIKDYLSSDHRNTLDAVIAINVLHTFADLKYAAFLIKDMLKPSGTAFVMDMQELPPLSEITAAILEDAFAKFTTENRPEQQNPMLTAEGWAELLADAGFQYVSYSDLQQSLFVFVVASGKEAAVSEEALKAYLSQQVPEYMIPERIVFTECVPLNKNGKADKERVTEIVSVEVETEWIPPQTETEQRVAELWKEVLGIAQAGCNQSFFKAGGDSLLATHLLAAVKKTFGIELTMKEMYADPTLEAIAAAIDAHLCSDDDGDMEFGEI